MSTQQERRERATERRQREAEYVQTNDPNILRQKAKEWAQTVVNLHHMPVPAEFRADKAKLLATAKTIKTWVESATGTIPQLDPLNQLGAIPVLVGVVGVGAAAAAITKWYTDYRTFVAKIDTYHQLRKEGHSAQEASALSNEIAGRPPSTLKSVFSDGKKIAALGVAGLLGWVLLKNRRLF